MARLRSYLASDPFDRELDAAATTVARALDRMLVLVAARDRALRRGQGGQVDPNRLRLLSRRLSAVKAQLDELPTVSYTPAAQRARQAEEEYREKRSRERAAAEHLRKKRPLSERRAEHDYNEGTTPKPLAEPFSGKPTGPSYPSAPVEADPEPIAESAASTDFDSDTD